MHLVLAGTTDTTSRPVEFTVAGGECFVFDAGPPEGEELVCTPGPWINPFTPPGEAGDPEFDAVNDEFVRISGEWRAFDVDDSAKLFDVEGRRIESVEYESTDQGRPVTTIFPPSISVTGY
ncbi:hypothetical protein CH260_03850 [Rhodococcus sp. 05-2256-B2]|uniref:hypothetical protein n=1 Tax=unclassified Rhodococcus (in: high G+C Gram-positive bacteria) TaxID=192944 RepID=UPI00050C225C|nr:MULTISPECIES: hypothetical protein [unclassified Rhodococcus (in: high G+C Gram-positive bacteria)]OZD78920.1 hypothetical protein CH258_23380 [Rhodococcus sp. 05-2256-B4]OZD94023.1 hypothetical protein CH257_11260 [Rhodococcus sp. 05-2256-B3]OZE01121.1 hypothetical protein CH260_03850 [Rhodococcus sp. 05-2256-B2]OZE04725.1 hypothetical protein CH285_10010 [Rhodococcus sp. 05-2256-B1]